MSERFFSAIFIGICVGVPLLLLVGWTRWARGEKPDTFVAFMALTSLSLATASALLAMGTTLVAFTIGGLPYHTGFLILIEACGGFLSLLGALFGIGGVWKPSSVRWDGLIGSIGTLLFWLAQLAGE